MSNKSICIFGEVLFDRFPDGQQVLGGAPFNVAWHLQAFSQSPYFISCIGQDAEGEKIRTAMQRWGMTTQGLGIDSIRPTGRVDVQFVNGEPTYDIVKNCAYDAIPSDVCHATCGLLYHGSLALRDESNRAILQQLKAYKPDVIYIDINLRPPWWQAGQIHDLLHEANWAKLNSDELQQLTASSPQELIAEYGLAGLIVTHGAEGAEVLTDNGEHLSIQPAAKLEVVDTVGAGDAFSAVMILGLVNRWALDVTLQRAQEFASMLVSNRGATINDMSFYRPLIEYWQL